MSISISIRTCCCELFYRSYNLPEDKVKPDGHDVFDELEQFFEKQKAHFDNNINQPISKAPVSASKRKYQLS